MKKVLFAGVFLFTFCAATIACAADAATSGASIFGRIQEIVCDPTVWGTLCLIALLVSEGMALFPRWKGNGLIDTIVKASRFMVEKSGVVSSTTLATIENVERTTLGPLAAGISATSLGTGDSASSSDTAGAGTVNPA